ncbi:hypothetical protein BN133_4039 [Cronobacter dublinensis 582]|nr:hypothetical protein BN133_4039 [Cronobacter dublinensis 582]
MRLFIAPAVAAHRPHQRANQQQVEENHRLAEHVVHQMQRRELRQHRPEQQRQQRQAHPHNLTPPVAGQRGGHIEVAHRHAVFFQHAPAEAEHQPEHRQLFAECPEQIADVELHDKNEKPHRQNNQANRQRADQVEQNGFRRMQLAVVAQLTNFPRELRKILAHPAEAPADEARNQQQRQPRQQRFEHSRPGFFPVKGDFHPLHLVVQRLREGFHPFPVHRFVTVNPEDLLREHLLQVFADAH